MRSSGGGGVKGACKAGARPQGGGGPRGGRSGVSGGDDGVRWGRERRHWRGGRGEVSGGGHRTRRQWCYRRRADKRGYSIRGDRCGMSGGAGPAGGATGAGHRPMCAR